MVLDAFGQYFHQTHNIPNLKKVVDCFDLLMDLRNSDINEQRVLEWAKAHSHEEYIDYCLTLLEKKIMLNNPTFSIEKFAA